MKKPSLFPGVLPSLFTVLWLSCLPAHAAEKIDLAGEWKFELGVSADATTFAPPTTPLSIPQHFTDTIALPGTTDTNRKGEKTTGSTEGTYTRRYRHIGRAWYQRTIDVPKQWQQNDLELFIERVLWKSTVYVDGKKKGDVDSLATPHVYNLGKLSPGKHTLTICIDNSMIHNIGDKSHSYGENMQTIWNGMLGQLELSPLSPIRIKAVRCNVQPNKDSSGALLVTVENSTSKTLPFSLGTQLSVEGYIGSAREKTTLSPGVHQVTLPLPPNLKLWDEFSPNLYNAKVVVKSRAGGDVWEGPLGFCAPGTDDTFITINGRPTFLRSNLDNCHFPLTGHPPLDKAGWLRVWKIYKDFGLNRVRFHSWCPPEAAFAAADEVGIYLQPEAGVWIDGWMKGRVNSKPEGISDNNPDVRDFVANEMKRIIDAYGHHPSFIMFCTGNELGSSDFNLLGKMISETRDYDGTGRLYSTSTARTLLPEIDDYFSSHQNPAGAMRGLRGPRTDWDYDAVKRGAPTTPLILHELGQWPIYPAWSEIEKYSGVVEARNFEAFRKSAQKNHLAAQDTAFQQATGKFSVRLYKAEMEAALRSKTYTGFDMLGLQDYMGQGEATIGILDMFYDLKPGIITPEEYREFCQPVVPLARFAKYTWVSGETFNAQIQVSNFSPDDLQTPVEWTLAGHEGRFRRAVLAQGQVSDIGEISIPLQSDVPLAATLTVSIPGTEYKNRWPIWIYPADAATDAPESVAVVEALTPGSIERLKAGGTTLLMAAGNMDKSIVFKNTFLPVYWSQGWFPGQNKTLGLLCDPAHPLFKSFPSEGFCDWQWYGIVNDSETAILTDLPADYRPLVQPIDDFHYNRKLGTVFEGRVGKGKLLVCTYPLQNRLNSPASKQLYSALLAYADSDAFQPTQTLPIEWLKKNFTAREKASVSSKSPVGSGNAALWVQVADKATTTEKDLPYAPALDVVKARDDGYGYTLAGAGAWKDEGGAFAFGKNLELAIDLPKGVEGTLYVRFNDWNNNGRAGQLVFENRDYDLGKHTGKEGTWVELKTMREDALDNRLQLKAAPSQGPNLQLDEFIFIPLEN